MDVLEKTVRILQKYDNIIAACVLGSVARGKKNPRDLDINIYTIGRVDRELLVKELENGLAIPVDCQVVHADDVVNTVRAFLADPVFTISRLEAPYGTGLLFQILTLLDRGLAYLSLAVFLRLGKWTCPDILWLFGQEELRNIILKRLDNMWNDEALGRVRQCLFIMLR